LRLAESSILLRATRDFADKEPRFAVAIGVEAIKGLLIESFHDPQKLLVVTWKPKISLR